MRSSLLCVLICVSYFAYEVHAAGKIACFYDSQAHKRKDLAKVTPDDLLPAASLCSFMIYGYAGVDKDEFNVKPLDKDLDTKDGQNNYGKFTSMRSSHPSVRYMLSIGGYDTHETERYLKLLEKADHRKKFVLSVVKLVNDYKFDGVDLAWKFPAVEKHKEQSTLGSLWTAVKEKVGVTSKDDKEKEHKEQFTALVRELAGALRGSYKNLTLSIMPHINAAAYYDVPNIKDHVEHIHLMTYDYNTPEYNEKTADFAAPTFSVGDRNRDRNIESTVKWWLDKKIQGSKLLIAIPTFGRTWKLTSESGKTGIPPLKADGAGKSGPYLNEEGKLAYYEICTSIADPSSAKGPSKTLLYKVPDASHRSGTYAYRQDEKEKGIWVSYDDPEAAGQKAYYAKRTGLGGVAIVDLSTDDFRGSCDSTHIKYPILRAAKVNS